MELSDCNRGTQIAYVPTHANDDLFHPDVEYGFITSALGDNAFCRFWKRGNFAQLRTLSCSEGTPIESLRQVITHSRHVIQAILKLIDDDELTEDSVRTALGSVDASRTKGYARKG